jgi:hypothetical protein
LLPRGFAPRPRPVLPFWIFLLPMMSFLCLKRMEGRPPDGALQA